MPKTIRRTIATTLTRETVRLTRPAAAVRLWCPRCGREARFVEPETAAVLAGVTRRQVYRALENGLVHFVEQPDSQPELLLICAASLATLF